MKYRNYKHLNERLKHLRLSNELTQEELADLLFVHVKTVGRYERGLLKPSFEVIERYARHFRVSANYILGIDINEQS